MRQVAFWTLTPYHQNKTGNRETCVIIGYETFTAGYGLGMTRGSTCHPVVNLNLWQPFCGFPAVKHLYIGSRFLSAVTAECCTAKFKQETALMGSCYRKTFAAADMAKNEL